ncbi:hypothetical protein [Halalkalibacterium ligniniphilum]|uniref:hypothetical protein n=1 Tax=Halalkalibacterium ligniniphilum TaxID=1134413 RepID=UPI00035C8EBD|nr:hypothetical protein [Halalkalibacterium ligniniphilum]
MADFTNRIIAPDPFMPGIDSEGIAISNTMIYDSSQTIIDDPIQEEYDSIFSNNRFSGSNALWDYNHSVGIPILWNLPPNIDYTYSARIQSNGAGSITGTHDRAPAHEITLYIPESGMSNLVYTRDNDGFEYLFPVAPSANINVSW